MPDDTIEPNPAELFASPEGQASLLEMLDIVMAINQAIEKATGKPIPEDVPMLDTVQKFLEEEASFRTIVYNWLGADRTTVLDRLRKLGATVDTPPTKTNIFTINTAMKTWDEPTIGYVDIVRLSGRTKNPEKAVLTVCVDYPDNSPYKARTVCPGETIDFVPGMRVMAMHTGNA